MGVKDEIFRMEVKRFGLDHEAFRVAELNYGFPAASYSFPRAHFVLQTQHWGIYSRHSNEQCSPISKAAEGNVPE